MEFFHTREVRSLHIISAYVVTGGALNKVANLKLAYWPSAEIWITNKLALGMENCCSSLPWN